MILLANGIFSLLTFMSYLLFSYTSVIVILFAGGIALYHILAKPKKSKDVRKFSSGFREEIHTSELLSKSWLRTKVLLVVF